jgi:hypothetical protein
LPKNYFKENQFMRQVFRLLVGACLLFLPLALYAQPATQQTTQVDADLNRWSTDSQNIKAVEHLGKPSL